jgi:hypothetical protein
LTLVLVFVHALAYHNEKETTMVAFTRDENPQLTAQRRANNAPSTQGAYGVESNSIMNLVRKLLMMREAGPQAGAPAPSDVPGSAKDFSPATSYDPFVGPPVAPPSTERIPPRYGSRPNRQAGLSAGTDGPAPPPPPGSMYLHDIPQPVPPTPGSMYLHGTPPPDMNEVYPPALDMNEVYQHPLPEVQPPHLPPPPPGDMGGYSPAQAAPVIQDMGGYSPAQSAPVIQDMGGYAPSQVPRTPGASTSKKVPTKPAAAPAASAAPQQGMGDLMNFFMRNAMMQRDREKGGFIGPTGGYN